MKKLAIFLLTVFTMGTAVVCGCGSAKQDKAFKEKIDTENVQIRTLEEDEQTEPECPDCKKRDDECPAPRKPHKRHDKRMPRPKSAYRKDK